jgi:hypothetical protein
MFKPENIPICLQVITLPVHLYPTILARPWNVAFAESDDLSKLYHVDPTPTTTKDICPAISSIYPQLWSWLLWQICIASVAIIRALEADGSTSYVDRWHLISWRIVLGRAHNIVIDSFWNPVSSNPVITFFCSELLIMSEHIPDVQNLCLKDNDNGSKFITFTTDISTLCLPIK